MARLSLQRQAQTHIALEFGSDLGGISDGSPVSRDEHGPRLEVGQHRADLAGVKSLKQGMTNREIGQRLYLSHRTVSTHLHRIFPKLGISSRGDLGAALCRGAQPPAT